jgi:hypothetical protein
MKSLFASLTFFLVASAAQAGGFGGPGSLSTSLDTTSSGYYQATARGESLSGIIRFAYDENGNPSATGNTFVFFIDGNIVTGSTEAAIMSANLAGMLYNPVTQTPINQTVANFIPTGGPFKADFDTKSANWFFDGSGSFQTYVQYIQSDGTTSEPVSQYRDYKLTGQRTSTTAPTN